MRARILIFCDFYLPGFKSGGGMWMVANLVKHFADEYDFFIVTRDHDGRRDRRPYDSIEKNQWNTVGSTRVFYFSDGVLPIARVIELFENVRPAAVYLNSAFSLPARQFLRGRRRKALADVPVILAPCGEMSEDAMSSKAVKKKLFLAVARKAGLYREIIWKASFDAEARDIKRVIGPRAEVLVAPDLAPTKTLLDVDLSLKAEKRPGSARFCYLSRIVPNKNLKFLLECFLNFRHGKVELEIIGPPEDPTYWAECEDLIARLPANIQISVLGPLPNHEVLKSLAASQFFVLPTQNENFGYAILEALSAGCPVLTTDRTEWNDMNERGAGWTIPLSRSDMFTDRLWECVAMDEVEYRRWSDGARRYAEDWLSRDDVKTTNAAVLEYAFARSSTARNDIA